MLRRQGVIVTVALLAVLAGCAGMGGGGADGGDAAVDASASDATAASGGSESRGQSSGDGGGEFDVTSVASVDRAIVRTGSMELTVDSFDATRDALAAEARRFGGFVGGSSQTLHRDGNVSWTTGQVVLRVPSEKFSAMVSFATEQGTVENVETKTEDVGDRLVELEARLTNLRARRDRLRTFYDRADSTNELLSIEERLSAVQGQIEQLRAQKRALEDRVAFSTLRVAIDEERPEPTDDAPDEDGQTVASAFLASVQQLLDIGYGLALGIAALAPFALVLGVPGAVGYRLYRRREPSRQAAGVQPEPEEE